MKAAMGTIPKHHRDPSDKITETVILEMEAIVMELTYVLLKHSEQKVLIPNHCYGSSGV